MKITSIIIALFMLTCSNVSAEVQPPTPMDPNGWNVYVQPSQAPLGRDVIVYVRENIVSDIAEWGQLEIDSNWQILTYNGVPQVLATDGISFIVVNQTIFWTKEARVGEGNIFVSIKGSPRFGWQGVARELAHNKMGWLYGLAEYFIPLAVK